MMIVIKGGVALKNDSGNKSQYRLVYVPVVAGEVYTLSTRHYFSPDFDAWTRTAFAYERNGKHHNLFGTKKGEWEVKSLTFTAETTGTMSVALYMSSVFTEGHVLIDWIQLEKKDHATPFVNGTRVDRVIDKTPYENHGTNYGATPTTDRHGKEGAAMSFDGIDDRISISYQNPVKETSVVAWFKREGPPAGGYHIITGGPNIEISIPDSSGRIRTGVTTNTQSRKFFNSGSGLNDGNWHQVGMTYDGINLRSFIDGELIAIRSVSGDLVGTAGEIGRYLSNSYAANGLIDDVRIYNRALSESEIQSLYDSYNLKTTTGTLQQGLVLDMPLKLDYTKNETAGSEIMTDRTPYSNDGQNYGAVLIDDSADFNGSTNYIGDLDTNNPALFEPSSITVSSWINLDTNASTNRHIWFTKWYGYSCEIQATTRLPYFRLEGPGDIRSNTPITPGKWHHFVGTYDPNIGGRVYLDGELVGSKPPNGDIKHSRNWPLNIGRYYGGVYFDGKISNALIYNRALSDEEVKTLYDRGRSDAGIIFQEN